MRGLSAVVSVLFLVACSEEAAPPSPPPPVEFELLAPGASGGAPPCVRRGDDPEQSITAEVRVRNFTLKPPLACIEYECGTVRFALEGGRDKTFESAQRFTSIPTVDLPDGVYRITATLLDTFGEPYEFQQPKKPKAQTRSFTLDATCGEVDPEPDVIEPELDAGEPQLDAGRLGGDAGEPRLDAGPSQRDAGEPRLDAGPPQLDAGEPRLDAGPPQRDAGEPRLDAGEPGSADDGGNRTDAAVDAGMPSADGG